MKYSLTCKMIQDIVKTGKHDTAKYRYVHDTNFTNSNVYHVRRIEKDLLKVADQSDWDYVGRIEYKPEKNEYYFYG